MELKILWRETEYKLGKMLGYPAGDACLLWKTCGEAFGVK